VKKSIDLSRSFTGRLTKILVGIGYLRLVSCWLLATGCWTGGLRPSN
jgi:hypothetical protein